MQSIQIGKSTLKSSRLAYGCWRIAETEEQGRTLGRAAVLAAFEAGYTLFDHADIYCGGRAESAFGAVLREVPEMRKGILIASKCGIRLPGDPMPDAPFRYDFSAQHIIGSCEQSLKRLGVETIDIYQLHRPDWLMEPTEVAVAFAKLNQAGKVREFGVSNFRPSQVTLLQQACARMLIVNQVEISLAALGCFNDGTLDQCLAEKITPLAWSPLGGGLLADGARQLLPWQEGYKVERTLTELDAQAKAHGTSRSNIALAWLLKHPSGIIPLVGSTQPEKIREAVQAANAELSREEWYRLLEAARGERLP
ncbi:MAG: aldo/keto reductase [Verrucomicrobia bacterium]|nr:aldo/keto reductase [Verrucomicrobiota bacterium]